MLKPAIYHANDYCNYYSQWSSIVLNIPIQHRVLNVYDCGSHHDNIPTNMWEMKARIMVKCYTRNSWRLLPIHLETTPAVEELVRRVVPWFGGSPFLDGASIPLNLPQIQGSTCYNQKNKTWGTITDSNQLCPVWRWTITQQKLETPGEWNCQKQKWSGFWALKYWVIKLWL